MSSKKDQSEAVSFEGVTTWVDGVKVVAKPKEAKKETKLTKKEKE